MEREKLWAEIRDDIKHIQSNQEKFNSNCAMMSGKQEKKDKDESNEGKCECRAECENKKEDKEEK